MHPIAKARKKANLTQTEVAKRVGVATAAVSLWESGRRTPRVDHAKKLVRVLPGLSLDRIYARSAA